MPVCWPRETVVVAEIRDANVVHDEAVAAFASAVQSAMSTAASQQQQQAAQFLAGSGIEGDVFRPGPADAPSL